MNDPASNSEPRRRWFRYSLRTLLVLLTEFCVWLAVVFNNARRQGAAVNAITSTGGHISFAYQFLGTRPFGMGVTYLDPKLPPPGPPWLRQIVGDEPFRFPVRVDLHGSEITDRFVADHLRGLTALEELWIESPDVTDESLTTIASMRDLKELTLFGPRITAEGLATLAPLQKLNVVVSFKDVMNQRAARALTEPTSIEMTETPLRDALEYLADFHNVPFAIDSELDAQVHDLPITFMAPSMPLTRALHEILAPQGLGFTINPSGITITSAESAQKPEPGLNVLLKAFPSAFQSLVLPTQIEKVDAPLSDVLDYLSDFHKVPIAIDTALDAQVHDLPITFTAKVMPLKTALHEILAPHGLGIILREGTITVKSAELARQRMLGLEALRRIFPNAKQIEADWRFAIPYRPPT